MGILVIMAIKAGVADPPLKLIRYMPAEIA